MTLLLTTTPALTAYAQDAIPVGSFDALKIAIIDFNNNATGTPSSQ